MPMPKKRKFGPPGPPQRPEPGEVTQVIMPDYPSIRRAYYRLDSLFALGLMVLELIFFVISVGTDSAGPSLPLYFLRLVVIPSAIRLLILFVISQVRQHVPPPIIPVHNFLPVLTLILIDVTAAICHPALFGMLAIFCVPICMAAVFNSYATVRLTAVLCGIGAVVVTLVHCLSVESASDRVRIVLESVVLILVLCMMLLAALTLVRMTETQKDKLLRYAHSLKTAKREAEGAWAEAEAATAQAQAASEAKSEFLANMSHEIRTPINAILGMNEMILRESENEQITEYANSIHGASTSLLYLVNDVLDFSKIESGRLEIVPVDYDTASFVHDCYSMVAERAEKKGLTMKVECDPDLPAVLHGDEVRCRQVVTNLLSNAVKYTDKGNIWIKVRSLPGDDGVFRMEISVKDTGIGIKPENLEILFSQFVRLDMEKNRSIEGTGLGLTITKQLVELMGGVIKVESVYGHGSTFTVTLPQEVSDPTPMGDFHKRYHDMSAKNEKYRQSFEAPSARILVVDDVEVNLKVIVNLLKKTKVKVDTAISGYQCLEMVAQRPYDLIFLDHMMPEMNGIETYARMRAMEGSPNRKVPVIMLTANAVSGVREQYLSEGFTDYLSKPVNGDKLEQMILKYLPQDKIQPVTAVETTAAKGPDWLMTLQELWQKDPSLDLGSALTELGSAEAVVEKLTKA